LEVISLEVLSRRSFGFGSFDGWKFCRLEVLPLEVLSLRSLGIGSNFIGSFVAKKFWLWKF